MPKNTAPALEKFPDADQQYTIEAEVTDPSGRTIRGSGTAVVTRTQFMANLSAQRGFYAAGEKVTVEVSTARPDGRPVAAKGTLKVYRISYDAGKNAKPVEELLFEEPLETDRAGRGCFERHTAIAGQFKYVFEATDAWGATVSGATLVWVAGGTFDGRRFRFQNIELITDKRSYREGETAHVMVNSAFSGAHVLLTREVEGRVLDHRLVHLPQRSKVIEMPLGRADVPNVFLGAVLVHGGEVFQESREVFVPPERQFLNVTLSSNQDDYKPGEKGSFTLLARNHKGEPVEAELSLAVFDRSVLSIQKETAPDIRTFFYGERRGNYMRTVSSFRPRFSGLADNHNPRQSYQSHGSLPEWWGYTSSLRRARLAFGRMGPGGVQGALPPDTAVEFAEQLSFRQARNRAQLARYKGLDAAAPEALAADQAESDRKERKSAGKGQAGPGALARQGQVRAEFAGTALWSPTVRTAKDGTARVELTFPEKLTEWKATAIVITRDTRVGSASATVRTTKEFVLHLVDPEPHEGD